MEYVIDFKCVTDNDEEIPEEVVLDTGANFPQVHYDGESMARLAQAIRIYNKDTVSMVPFCMTVEAEALGAHIKMGDRKRGPRVSNYVFKNMEDFKKIKPIDLSKGRINQVLKAVNILSSSGEQTALAVQGPFTVMSSLMDPRTFYKAIRKDKASVDDFMEVIIDSIVSFAEAGIENGAKIISFGDSAGTLDILGPRIYKNYSGRYSYEVLKKLYPRLQDAIVHFCGITSSSMDKGGFVTSEPIEVEKGFTYGEALNYIMENRKDVKIVGHNCMRKTPAKMKTSVVWKINL
ncbi:uroporphyrinogen decarboxylase family protein [Clostridium sp. MT-14]|mgnify:CR=1 FL=1|jgi:MtaA/CmuA family methyltransferase|uniref:Methylcobamide--CoM methyltransferase n=1 Tax=Clostridium aromativorans TaxID=2836848 RepID=A0ABS8N7R8_9CLOT|nr:MULTISPECIES: uroporphyrinogen decarboxylase family protein [Clostridium]KAA8672992.1 methylcobamide--CoM methyltransferase [Clostridium sp. HV4-5-A1G]MCC9295855.1 methylcobamide--CoM methyltransferase [Clostridium aromativorans]CAB1245022.1 Methylcobamide--CoM methyltransferase [Clostridiaceae bacterium BL-3]